MTTMTDKKPRQPSDEPEREDRPLTIGGREITWSKHWDDPEDYGIDIERGELDGLCIGQRVAAVDEYQDPVTGLCNAEEGQEGIIIGITLARPGGGPFNIPPSSAQILVGWDEFDPTTIEPHYLEVL